MAMFILFIITCSALGKVYACMIERPITYHSSVTEKPTNKAPYMAMQANPNPYFSKEWYIPSSNNKNIG